MNIHRLYKKGFVLAACCISYFFGTFHMACASGNDMWKNPYFSTDSIGNALTFIFDRGDRIYGSIQAWYKKENTMVTVLPYILRVHILDFFIMIFWIFLMFYFSVRYLSKG